MNILRRYPKKLFWTVYFIGLVVSLVLDLAWIYLDLFHYHFAFQYLPEFFAIFGLFGCMLLILIARGMGYFIVKDEEYYEKRSRS